MRSIVSIVAFGGVCLLPVRSQAQDLNGFEARTLQGSKGLTLPYRLYKVKDPAPGMKYPLILFLHGAGERGNDNTAPLMANAGATVWATAAHQAKHPAYVIAPQCPADKQWVDTDWGRGSYSTATVPVSIQLTTALEIADAIAKEFDTDPLRQYVTGVSMGGYGTWDAIVRNPERFAAALPICGSGDPSKADSIKLLPIWTFHGDADPTVPVKGTRDMVAALKAVGSSVKYDEYPGVGHDAWGMTYANEAVIDWLFTNQKGEPPGTGGVGGSGGAGGSSSGAGGSGGGGGTAGIAASAGGSNTSAGAPSGGATGGAGTPISAGAGTATSGGSSMVAANHPSDDSGCSFRAPRPGDEPSRSALLLGAAAAWFVSRRRRSRTA